MNSQHNKDLPLQTTLILSFLLISLIIFPIYKVERIYSLKEIPIKNKDIVIKGKKTYFIYSESDGCAIIDHANFLITNLKKEKLKVEIEAAYFIYLSGTKNETKTKLTNLHFQTNKNQKNQFLILDSNSKMRFKIVFKPVTSDAYLGQQSVQVLFRIGSNIFPVKSSLHIEAEYDSN